MAPKLKLVVGGDYGFPPTPQGQNAFDLQCFVEWFNFSPIETLVCATANGAELMGMKIGHIKPGFLADILLVKGDPTKDVKLLQGKDNILVIMQDGFLYKNIFLEHVLSFILE